MGIGVNTLKRKIRTASLVPDAQSVVDATVSLKQGDLVCLIAGLLALAAAETDGATFLGVMPVSIVDGKFPPVYPSDVDAAAAISALAGPEYGDVHEVILKTGDAVTPMCPLYLDPATGSRGVTVTGTKQVGIYQGPALTGVAGQKINMLVGTQFAGALIF